MRKTIKTLQKPVHQSIRVPGSKSITNRALLLAALAEGHTTLSQALFSDDTRVFANALQNLGVSIAINEEEHQFIVKGVGDQFPKVKVDVWCQDAGTATRFLLAACANSKGHYHIDGSARMRERPIHALLEVLIEQGARVEPPNATSMPFELIGTKGLRGGDVFIPGKESSQFLSALLMIAPFAKTPMKIRTEHLVSRPYVTLTCEMMAEFGASVQQAEDEYFIDNDQTYQGRDYLIEPDLSTASYFFAAAALTQGEIKVFDISRNESKQGDVQFLTVLELMGCEIIDEADGLIVKGAPSLHGVDVDMGDFSDTFMTLACIAPFANEPTTIRNISHTRLQESDRVEAVEKNLHTLGIKTKSEKDSITIYPSIPQPSMINSYRDHRIAMAFSLIGLKIPDIIIDGAECVSKTCPNFFDLWDTLHEDNSRS